MRIINENCRLQPSAAQLDTLLAQGWRHFGNIFFRYNITQHEQQWVHVFPLRVDIASFSPSKSQRKIKRKFEQLLLNSTEGLEVTIQPLKLTDASYALFERHKQRFANNIPENIYIFLGNESERLKEELVSMLSIYRKGELIAESYFSCGEQSISSIYGMFHPDFNTLSLGLVTMLLELEYAEKLEKVFYYQGYVYSAPSFYDYKLKFRPCHYYDWQEWRLAAL
jgi:arginine-tRNA-protein transferase